MGIYLDNASTTRISDEVYLEMEPYLKMFYGNASSHHSYGEVTRKAIDNAREVIAETLNCKPQEIYFTSGGSESNTWAIRGLANPYRRRPMHIISDNQEHHSILNALSTRWSHNDDIVFSLVEADVDGKVDVDMLTDMFQINTRLCSIQTVNNETGIVQPIAKIAYKCKDEGCIFHTDAVQSFGYMRIDVDTLAIDMLSASAHKIHGPKGVGFLYISDSIKNQMIPLINGGQQERGLRGSTENVAGIVGLKRATEIAYQNIIENNVYLEHLAKELVNMLSHLPGVHTNVHLGLTDYRHISIRLDNVRAEEMLSLLDSVDICVSSGSACSSDSNKPSHVLKAIGLTDEQANSTIRVSINETNTLDELKEFVNYLKTFLEVLRERS